MASPDGPGRDMSVFVFNGDADGLAGQHILGLELGPPDLRITGLKRDIKLLAGVPSMDSGHVRAVDISLRQNLEALPALLARGNIKVTWYDHHDAGEPKEHPNLTLHINQAPDTCTAAIVNAVCGRKYPLWAAMAAFGDGLPATAGALLAAGGATAAEGEAVREAGILVNYNAYGESSGDVLFAPADLAERMAPFASAPDFAREASILRPLAEQFAADRERFRGLSPVLDAGKARIFLVPDEAWARRYAATWANERILAEPSEALAMIHPRSDGAYSVSIRAPRGQGSAGASAADLAREFPTGGGRKLAAGINSLPHGELERFMERFRAFFGG